MKQYKLYKSETIIKHLEDYIKDCNTAYNIFNNLYNPKQIPDFPTQAHYSTAESENVFYNIFTLTPTSLNFYYLYKELVGFIKHYLNNDEPFWLSAWINFDRYGKTLTWHNHDFPYHGYISIDPKNTKTIFKDWTIDNEPGLIYIGPGDAHHKVEALEPFEGYRITIGFDIETKPNITKPTMCSIPVL